MKATLITLCLCIVFQSALSMVPGGSRCLCVPALRPWGCTPLALRYRPRDGTLRGSELADAASTSVPSGVIIPRIVLEVVANGTSTRVTQVDSTYSAAVRVITTDSVTVDVSSTVTTTFQDGLAIFSNILVHGQTGAQLRFNFTTDLGLFIVSEVYGLYASASLPSFKNTPISIALLNDGTSYFATPALVGVPPIVFGTLLPPVRLRVVDPAGNAVYFLDGTPAMLSASYVSGIVANLTLTGTSATVVGSDIVFDQISVSNTSLVDTPFAFLFEVAGQALQTRAITGVVLPVPNYRVSFDTRGETWITTSTTVLHACVNIPVPSITVRMLNSANLLDTGSAVFVRVSVNDTTVAAATSVVPTSAGVAKFEQLTFLGRQGVDSRAYSMRFAVDTNGRSAAATTGAVLMSPPLYLWSGSDCDAPRYIRFRPFNSYIRFRGQQRATQSGAVLPPIVVELINAKGLRSTLSVVSPVQVSCSVGQALTGTSNVPFNAGVATFSDLVLSSKNDRTPVTLTFAVSGLGEPIASGTILVLAANTAASLRFEPSSMSWIASDRQRLLHLTSGVPAPLDIVIQVLDTSNAVHDAVDGVHIKASCSGRCTPDRATVAQGRAIFRQFTFALPSIEAVTFTADSSNTPHAALDGATIMTMPVTVESQWVPYYSLRFHADGHVVHEEQHSVVCLGGLIPPIGVVLVDSSGQPSPPPAQTVAFATVANAAFTPNVPNISSTFGIDGVAWFNLTLSASTVAIDPVLCFSVAWASSPAAQKRLCTGSMSVAPSCSSPLALRLAPASLENFTGVVVGTSPHHEIKVNSTTAKLLVSVGSVMAGSQFVQATNEVAARLTIRSNAALAINTTLAPLALPVVGLSARKTTLLPVIALTTTRNITGFTSAIRITSGQPTLQYSELQIGPITDVSHDQLDAIDIMVAEVNIEPRQFRWVAWRDLLLSLLNIEPDRVQLVRWREGGTAFHDASFTWRGVRIEFRILPPTTASTGLIGFRDLGDTVQSLTDTCNGLRLRRAYRKASETTCDLFRLAESLTAARRCTSVSSADDRCSCYIPVFSSVGAPCSDTTQLKLACSQLLSCTDSSISQNCAAYKAQIVWQYLQVFAVAVGSVFMVVLAYGFASGTFTSRLKRRKLDSSERNATLKEPFVEPSYDALL